MTINRDTFKWRWLAGCQLGAFALLGSWMYAPTRVWWDKLDSAVFTTLNTSLAELGPGWQLLWAVGNNRSMDLVMAAIFAGLYLHFIFAGERGRILPRVATGCFIALYAFLVLELSRNVVFTFPRLSPTLVEEGAVRLSSTLSWVNPKDSSGDSFPGDHAIALFIFVSMIWFYAGRRYGVWALAVALPCALPRLVAGAHWASDLLVGSAFMVLVFQSLLMASPLQKIIEYGSALLANAALAVGSRACRGFGTRR